MSTTPHDAPYASGASREGETFMRAHPGLTALVALALVVGAAVAVSPRTVTMTLPKGTVLVGALTKPLSTGDARVGQVIQLTRGAPAQSPGGRSLPRDLTIRGDVIHVKGGGRLAGAPELTLGFYTLEVNGAEYPIMADVWRAKGRNDARESVVEIGGGAVAGGVIGAVAGNTLAGAAVGAALGTGVALATSGDEIVLPAGQKLRIRLAEPVTIRYRAKPVPGS